MGVIDDLIATAQPRTEKVRICARGDLVASHAEAVVTLAEATAGEDSLESTATSDAAAAVVAVEEEMEAATVTFTVASVSRQKWADLLAQHPPSKEEQRAGKDSDGFVVAAVAACIVDPPTSLEQVQILASKREDGTDVLSPAEFNKLYQAVLLLNITGTPHPKLPAATELLQVNGQSSTTPVPEGSLEDSSLVGSGTP